MITAIPNQPIDFVGNPFSACGPENPSSLMIGPDDTIIFQFISTRCEDAAQLIDNTDLTEWSTLGDWDIKPNDACIRDAQDDAYLAWDSFNPTVGDLYEIEIVVTSIIGTIRVTVGGYAFDITSEGTHTQTFVASDTEKVIITIVGDDTRVCLFSAMLYEGNEAVSVTLIDDASTTLFDAELGANPEYFSVSGDHITVTIPMVNVPDAVAGMCFKIFVNDNCTDYGYDGSELCSQTITVPDDCQSTLRLRVCNDQDQEGMGFVAGYFEARVPVQVLRPKFSYKVEEETLANGYINRAFANRDRVWELVVPDVWAGSSLHDFLSAIAVFDHFYIGTTEFSMDAEEYQPAYADSASFVGAVQITIRPKQELFQKVQCDTIGEGCNPVNDPICNVPNVTLTGEYADDGTYRILVSLTTMFGFVTGSILVTVDDAPDAPIVFNTAPNSEELGPYVEGQVIIITITNAVDPDCNYTFPRIVVGESPNFVTGGLNNEVSHIRVLSNGLIVISGNFTLYDATSTPYFTALNANGTLNGSFNSGLGSGFDIGVGRFELDSSERIVVGGSFTEIDGTSSNRIARINANGLPDLAFSASIGTGFAGPGPGAVSDLAITSAGSIFCVGQFTSYNGTGSNRVIALLPTGGIDTSFVYGTGFDSAAERIVIAPDGTLLISSRFFTFYNGTQVKYGFATIVRLNANGTLNSMALHASGAPQFNATVRDIAVQPDGKILVFGGFTTYDGVACPRMARLNTDWTLDTAFMTNLGAGFDTQVETGYVQPDGRILVCADGNLDGVATNRLVRLNADGTRDVSFNATAPGFDGGLGAVYYDAGTTLAGGFYTHYNGVLRKYINRIP